MSTLDGRFVLEARKESGQHQVHPKTSVHGSSFTIIHTMKGSQFAPGAHPPHWRLLHLGNDVIAGDRLCAWMFPLMSINNLLSCGWVD